jgi:hypothetical protein
MEIDFDFDGSLRLADVVGDFFHSPSTGMYVFRHPVIVDKRVLAAADEIGLRVEASPEKWLVNIRLADALRLLEHLGSTALSLPEYFKVRRDAIDAGDEDMVHSLEPDQFLEMLATVFVHDEHMIHHPASSGPSAFSGDAIPVNTPAGRYGWILQDEVDLETGLPTRVSFERNIHDRTIKYWDTHTDIGREGALMSVRGYVTSVGKVSLDLGFPADAISHKLTIRECRRERPAGVLDEAVLDAARDALSGYDRALEDKTLYTDVPAWCGELLAFVRSHCDVIRTADDVAGQVLRGDVQDALGSLWLVANARGNDEVATDVRACARELSGLTDADLSDESFLEFVRTSALRMERARAEHESVVFVKGHENPDTDTIVSALAEAYRNHLLHGDESVFVPVVPGRRVPDEVVELLGEELAGCLVLTEGEGYRAAAASGRPEWIAVDHNIGPEQPDTRAIIDHHFPDPVPLRQAIPRRIIFAGSTSGLVTLRYYGIGLDIPGAMARILHGATLMDTENRFPGKMTPLDELVMDRLAASSGATDETGLYRSLMRRLITCYDAEKLFRRDYKEDWCFFGFAVAKAIRILDDERAPLVARLRDLAAENNRKTNLPLTLLKIVDYDDDAETIRRERMYPVFAERSSPEFERTVRSAIETVIRHESPPGVKVKEHEGAIEYWGVGTQLSRKKLAPVMDPVVTAFNQYFYSPSNGFYVRRDFLRGSPAVEETIERLGLDAHIDEDGIVVGNPGQLKFILQELGFSCTTPAEYFRAWADARVAGDERMVRHLTSPRYLETLDAIVEDKSALVEHPVMSRVDGAMRYEGARRKVKIPEGVPGLIDPEKVGPDTGLPTTVEDPRQYGSGRWRYWSPDSDRAWVLRSTIFAYDIPSLDLKFGFDEALPRLSIRPCVGTVTPPSVEVYEEAGTIRVVVKE